MQSDGGPVEITSLAAPTAAEQRELIRRCRISNSAIYTSAPGSMTSEEVRDQLWQFSNVMKLSIAEEHRSAGRKGIVALEVTNAATQRGYIPYSRKAMNWHTDGYYNCPEKKIRAMVLHCVRPAEDGGVNQFLDPEIAYIRLRDENPGFVAALMHSEAMSIPENLEADGSLRPVSIGPVFSVDPNSGNLEMRYTARTRSISWRKDETTENAVAFLNKLLETGDEFMETVRFRAGQGVLCNNSLHNRTGFDSDPLIHSTRLMYRIRFHNRVTGS